MKRNSPVRRLLVITYHFPPDGSIGGQRWAGLSKYLARLGWEVHIVTASPATREQSTPGVYRHVRDRRRTLNDVYRASVGRFRQPPKPHRQIAQRNSGSGQRSALSQAIAAARRVVASAMFLPDHGRGWVGRAAGAARMLLRENRFDVVITSGPPHSSHFAGMLATRGDGAQFWMDMRDPWSTTHEGHTPDDRIIRAERRLLASFERLLFARAAKVIVNTQEFALALRRAEPELDVVSFPNGIDLDEMPVRDASAVELGSIAHVGTLYAGRNLTSVIAAMSALLHVRPEAATMLRLNVAGAMDAAHREQMLADIATASLTSIVSVHGVLPRAQALELLNRSHLALVLAQDQPMQVPAKLYECVGLGIPTLVIAEETSAAATEARRVGAMTLDGSDLEALRGLLDDMLAGRIPTMIPARTPISYEELAIQMDRLLRDALDERHTEPTREPYRPAICSE